MKKIRRKTLLAVGDSCDFDSFGKLYRERKLFINSGFIFKHVSYEELLKNKTPEAATSDVIILLFFPFEYWNKKIETKTYKGVYGNKKFYIKFQKLWKNVEICLRNAYPDKKLYFINSSRDACACRDKVFIKKAISKAGILTPKLYSTKNPQDVYRCVNRGKRLFIKVRFGSMGKGITFLTKDDWFSNFGYRSNKITSRKSDYGWKFKNITGKNKFLEKLLKADVIIEEAVDNLPVKDKIFDLRVYVFFGEVMFVYPRVNKFGSITTNISQGACGQSSRFLKYVSSRLIAQAKRNAVAAADAVKLNFAGVDILIDGNKKDIYVLEVNAFPGFPRNGIFKLAKHLIRDLCRRKDIIKQMAL